MGLSISFSRTIIASAVAASISLHAVGQEQNDTDIVLDTLNVKGQTYRNTATKTLLEPEETPQGISIVGKEELTQRGVESLSEAVRYTPGVSTELRGASVKLIDFFNIRGFINYQNYYDGLRLPYSQSGFLQAQIDPVVIEQVEVFKGPTSTLYGSLPPGGFVNMISKTPQSKSSTELGLTLGTSQKKELELDTTGPLSDTVNYRLTGVIRSQEGQATGAKEERIVVAPSIDWQVSDDTLINVNLYYQDDPEQGILGAIPASGSVYNNSIGELTEETYLGDNGFDANEKEVALFGYKIDHTINDTWQFLHNARYMEASLYNEFTSALGDTVANQLYTAFGGAGNPSNPFTTTGGLQSDGRTFYRSATANDEKSKAITIDNQFSAVFDSGDIEHNILIGLDYFSNTLEVYRQSAATMNGNTSALTIDIFNPDNNQFTKADLDFNSSFDTDFTVEEKQLGVYLQDQARMDQWVFIASTRYDKYKATQQGKNVGSTVDVEIDQKQLTSRLAALYELDNGFSPFISYAESFEPIAGTDRNGNEFDTSTASQIETGVKFLSRRGLSGSATAYQIIKSNVLTQDPNGSSGDQVQTGEVTARGFEIEVQKQLTPSLNLMASYNYQDVEVTEDNSGIEGNTPIYTPDHQASAWLNYQVSDVANIATGLRHVGKTQLDAANSDEVPDYTLVDVSMGYDLTNLNTQLQLSISNLFDEDYFVCYDEDSCYFGDKRSVQVSARHRF